MPLYPSKVLQARERAPTPYSFIIFSLDSHLSPSRSWEGVTWSLETLELSAFITFLLLITIREVCMLKSEISLLGVNNLIK